MGDYTAVNIVKASARLERLGGVPFYDVAGIKGLGIQALQWIEYCARISHRSEEKQTEDSYLRFIKAVVVDKGDWSVVEHASASVQFIVDRGITHELVRHRLFSFTQESTRFVNYEKKNGTILIAPPNGFKSARSKKAWEDAAQQSEDSYMVMLEEGESPQIARDVLLTGLSAKIMMTGNLRNWRHFFIMRTTKETHPKAREVAIPLLKEFQQIPLLFDGIEPEKRQIDNLRLPR